MTNDSAFTDLSLRARAERLAAASQQELQNYSLDEVRRLVHELQVHQIELQLQNEELQSTLENLELSRQQFYALFNQAPVGYLVLDSIGLIQQMNDTFCTMINRQRESVIHQPLSEFILEPDRDIYLARYRAFYKNPQGKTLEARIARNGGGELFVRMHGAHLMRQIDSHEGASTESPAQLLITVSDISDRQRAEKALEESEKRYRLLAENAKDIVYRFELAPEPHFSYVSPASTWITGYTPEDHYADPQLGYKLVHPDDQNILNMIVSGGVISRTPITLRWVRKDGQVIWTEQINVPIQDDHGNLIAIEGIARDITERKLSEDALRESESRYRALFITMEEGFALHEIIQDENDRPVDYRFLDVNPAFERLTGLSRDQLIGKTIRQVMPGIEEDWIERYGNVSISGVPQHFTSLANELGRYYSVHAYSPKKGRFAVIFSDVTEQKRTENALRATLEERKLLYRELQHRTKNSMALIVSIISLETYNTINEEATRVLSNVRDRIRTLSELYRLLYLTGDTQRVRLDTYFQQVVETLQSTYESSSGIAVAVYHSEPVEVDEKTAASIGLILNELVTNALKYAYPAGKTGTVKIRLSDHNGELTFEVEDDGVGLPDDFNMDTAEGLGMQLVQLLSNQLEGTLVYHRRSPTLFKITIPARSIQPVSHGEDPGRLL